MCFLCPQVAILHFTYKNVKLIHCTKIQMFLMVLLHILSGFRNIISQNYFTHFLCVCVGGGRGVKEVKCKLERPVPGYLLKMGKKF
jgi:hypothetical protein